MNSEEIESIKTPVFGNKWILRWESDRNMKEQLMKEATSSNAKDQFQNLRILRNLVIVKRQGAAGGKGYFMAAKRRRLQCKKKPADFRRNTFKR